MNAQANLKFRKWYKAIPPAETIKKIRDILFENDIFVIEKSWNEVSEDIISVSVEIFGLPCSTNGKSFNGQYALASAYGEFMERLQNLILVSGKNYIGNQKDGILKPSDCLDFDYNSFKKRNTEIINVLFEEPDQEKIERILLQNNHFSSIPFYHVQSGQIEYLPYEWIVSAVGSNGMCAGNILEEALIQGFCEIFERFVLKEIYFNPERQFPTIPEKFFENTPQKKYIAFLKENGFEVLIKDCSLNGKVPVIAVIVKKKDKALISLGAAPDYLIAFERCITELFQGISLEQLDKKLMPIVSLNDLSKISEKELKHLYFQSLVGIRGSIPETVLNNDGIFNPENLFKSESMISKDILTDLLKLCDKQKWQVYIRDVSFLGFPAYWIYIPGLSETYRIIFEEWELAFDLLPKVRRIFLNIEDASKAELQFLTQVIKKLLDMPRYERNEIIKVILGLSFKKPIAIEKIEPEMLAVFIMYKSGDYKGAYEMLKKYLTTKKTSDKAESMSVFSCLLEFLYHLAKGDSLKECAEKINKIFEPSVVTEIYNLLNNPEIMNEYLHIPQCNSCNDCNNKHICCYEDMSFLAEKLKCKMNEHQLNQENIKKYFKGLNQN